MEPELIADYQCECGEGPLWHPDEKRLYWVDIPTGRMFRYEPASGRHEQCYQGEMIGGFTVQEDGELLLFKDKGAIKTWRDGERKTLIEEIPAERETRFNDVGADPEGRVFCGTMSTDDRPGRLFRLDPDGTLTTVLEDVGCSNGIGYTPDRTRMYYTDSNKYEIYLFDYDRGSGAITNRRVFVKIPKELGLPDGMTVDADGYVWTAIWGGGCLIRFAPDGTEDRRLPLPANQVTCVTFAGEDYADMYVTTAGGQNKAENGPGAGALFRFRLGIRGVPEFRSKIRV
ncbi:MAG: SMP-30/gluconolactonase/LRE family protein [Phycisphaerae bacterium]|nr:SMP-30/gluconolactonase/LRE family protein [Phycisphaerae bacterium]